MHQQSQIEQVSRFDTVIMWISRVMAVVSAVALAAMMMIVVINVVGRYVFLRPLEGDFELVGLLLVIAGSWGMGYCQLLKGNIRINIIIDLFRPRGQAILNFIAYLICLATAGMICWQTLLRVQEYMNKELGYVTETLSLLFWPFMLMMAIGLGWLCVVFLIDISKTLKEVFRQ